MCRTCKSLKGFNDFLSNEPQMCGGEGEFDLRSIIGVASHRMTPVKFKADGGAGQ